MKRFLCLLLFCSLLLSSCAALGTADIEYQKYSHYFFGTFDTIITLMGYTGSEEEFNEYAAFVETEMRRYHEIFDIYNSYSDVNNVYLVNKHAGEAPVQAEPELIDLLLLVNQWQSQYATKANPAMGSVLQLWHNARMTGAYLPEKEVLAEAANHTDYQKIQIDSEAKTVYFTDPELSLDLGAVAKGYAAQLVAQALREKGFQSFILNAGGNVVCNGAPLDGRTEWSVAIEDVDGASTKVLIGASNVSIVTSGDYQRYYEYEGKRYHHLIDPETLFPAEHIRAVTILHPDSGLSDFLSTTAFLMPYEESRALVDSIPEAEALWTLNDGTEVWTDGFAALLR